MALPDNFSPFEQLQDMIRLNHNRLVREYFSDVGAADWEPDLVSPRSQLRVASTMLDDDTAEMTLMRLFLFYDILGYSRAGLAEVFGDVGAYQPPVEGHPRIVLYFSQDQEAAGDYQPIDAEISFRLMAETQETFTPSNARSLAIEIKNLFIEARKGIVFTKGKFLYTYKDEIHGYRLQIYGSTSESDITDIIKKLLQLTNTVYDADKLTTHEPKKNNLEAPGTHSVYGKTRKKKRYRPTGNVRFRNAFAEIPGLPKKVCLVDTTYRYTPLIDI